MTWPAIQQAKNKHQPSTHQPANRCVLQDTNGRTPIPIGDSLPNPNMHVMSRTVIQ